MKRMKQAGVFRKEIIVSLLHLLNAFFSPVFGKIERRVGMFSQNKGCVWPSLVACFLLTVLLAACSSGTPTPISSHVSPTPTPPLGAPGCRPPSPLEISNLGFPEALGTTPARDLWSLFLGGVPPVHEDGKIIWRDGESFQYPIQVVALGPRGERLQPLFFGEA